MIELKMDDEIIERHKKFVFGENMSFDEGRLVRKLKLACDSETETLGKDVYRYVLTKIDEIVLGEIKRLFEIREEFKIKLDLITTLSTRKRILDKLKNIFLLEYRYFYSDPVFNAYDLQSLLDINICPLCGTQFIFLYESDNGQTRGTLDHFIDKAKYPIFAVSIYNLIPCCKVCNSDFKKSDSVDLINNYSPYESGIVKYIKFQKKLISEKEEQILPEIIKQLAINEQKEIDYVSSMLGINNEFNIIVDYSSAPVGIAKKIKGNIDLFKIDVLYNMYHKNFVREQIRKAYVYNYVYRKQLMYNFSNLFVTEEELKRLIVPKAEDDNKYILNKLIRDIVLVETESFTI